MDYIKDCLNCGRSFTTKEWGHTHCRECADLLKPPPIVLRPTGIPSTSQVGMQK